MKIKDIISEAGIQAAVSGFAKGLVPQALRPAVGAKKSPPQMTDLDIAREAHKKFGDNPESVFPGVYGWLSKEQQDTLAKEIENQKKKEYHAARAAEREKSSQHAAGMGRLARDVFGTAPVAAQSLPPLQVNVPGYGYITKDPAAGNVWRNESGQEITDPTTVAQLEKRATTQRQTQQMYQPTMQKPFADPTQTKGVKGFKRKGSKNGA